MGLYTPTILGGNSYLSWFYDRGAIKDPAHTGTSKGLSQAINRGPIRKFLPKYANVYVTIQSRGLSAGARSHYVTANGVRDGLPSPQPILKDPQPALSSFPPKTPPNDDRFWLVPVLKGPVVTTAIATLRKPAEVEGRR